MRKRLACGPARLKSTLHVWKLTGGHDKHWYAVSKDETGLFVQPTKSLYPQLEWAGLILEVAVAYQKGWNSQILSIIEH